MLIFPLTDVRTSQRSRSAKTYMEADDDGSDIIDEDDLIPVHNSRFIEGMGDRRDICIAFTHTANRTGRGYHREDT